MQTEVLWALGPPGLILLGFCLLWAQSWMRQYGTTSRRVFDSRLATLLIWIILLVGVLATTLINVLFLAPPLWIVAGIVLAAAVVRYWRSEVRFLIWSLSAAAARGIPLETAARAFARDHRGLVAARASRLADYLDAAMPLSLALARSGLMVYAPELRLAAAVGEKTGTLGDSLRKSIEQSADMERVLGSILARFTYLACVAGVLVMILTFVMLKIVPTFQQMFEEFGIALPGATHLLIAFTRGCAEYWYLVPPLAVLIVVGLFGPLVYYLAPAFRAMPIIGYFFSPVNEISVLQLLAVAVAQQRPVVGSLELLASYSHAVPGRTRLDQAIGDITGGSHWCDALQRARLVTSAQSAVFKSAERAGNLAWALEMMADRTLHRAALRARAVLQIAFPALICALAVCVGFVALALMLPLFSLISGLT